MNASTRPVDEPPAEELAGLEARKAEARARKVADEWPKSPEPGVYWDGELWEAKAKVEGQKGNHRKLIRTADAQEAIRTIRAALRKDDTLRPGLPSRREAMGLPDGPPRESIAFPALKAAIAGGMPKAKAKAVAPPVAAATPSSPAPATPHASDGRPAIAAIQSPPPAARPARAEAAPTSAAGMPAELAAVAAVLAAVEGLPRPAAKWAVFAALAHLEQIKGVGP